MQLKQERGSYCGGDIIRLYGAFRIDGTSDPDAFRDGNSALVYDVVRVSAGLFTVYLSGSAVNDYFPVPEMLIHADVQVWQVAAPSQPCRASYVLDSWSQVTRTFQVKCLDYDTPSAVDPDDNDMISFELVGSISSNGTDAS